MFVLVMLVAEQLRARPAGLPPSQGGKYVGFGSAPPAQASSNQGQVRTGVGVAHRMLLTRVLRRSCWTTRGTRCPWGSAG